jgi:hypothetical protein
MDKHMQQYTNFKEIDQAYIKENIKKTLTIYRCSCSNLSKSSFSNPLLEISMIRMTILLLIIILLFTMIMPPFIGFERLNHLGYIFDKSRI